MSWAIKDGRILTWALESHVVEHCNLWCANCCTLSPSLPERFVDPAALRRDLTLAALALAPQTFKLTGGEPLLHPDLLGCIEAARASGISPTISITTNGLLARTVPDDVWPAIDRMTVSFYTSAPLPEATIEHIEDRCAHHGVLLTWKATAAFQRMSPDSPWTDEAAVRAVWDSCWLKVRCHMVHDGRFHLCTRPPHIAAVHGNPMRPEDSVALDSPTLLHALMGLLERPTPMGSCTRCLGATGERSPHAQLPAA